MVFPLNVNLNHGKEGSEIMLHTPSHNQHKAQGMALVSVMCLMAILFLLGSAALTNKATETKICKNYVQSVQAFYDCEAGIAAAMAQIENNTATLDQLIDTLPDSLFQGQYCITQPYADEDAIYQITSTGHDLTESANRQITAEVRRLLGTGDIYSPVYCDSGDQDGQPNTIYGDCNNCPGWANDSDPNNDTSVPCVATPNSYVSDTDPLDFHEDQLHTSDPNKIVYDAPEIDLRSIVDYYKSLPSIMTSIPGASGDIGSPTDPQIVYLTDSQTVSNKTGYGILIVETTGDLHISGQLEWYGVVIVLGSIHQTGQATVTGSILTPNEFDFNGNPDVYWCGDIIRKVLTDLGTPPLKILSWKEE